MKKQIQLMLIEETPEDKIRREIQELRESQDKVRKSQFAKIGNLQKLYEETRHELHTLKAAICKNHLASSIERR
jgi:hypothetical protein